MTFFGATFNSGSGTSQVIAVTPPASMVRGQLVVLYGQFESSPVGTLAISNAGGQDWTNRINTTGTGTGFGVWTCTFNGTWSANPSLDFGNVNPTLTAASITMQVVSPTSRRRRFVFESFHTYATTGNVVCEIGDTAISATSTVAICSWISFDGSNTWGNLTATWTTAGLSVYTTSGSGMTSTYAYKIFTTNPGSSGIVSKEQLTNGPDNSLQSILVFAEAYKSQIL